MDRTDAVRFAERHNMYYEQLDFAGLRDSFLSEMLLGLQGPGSSIGMFPSYLRPSGSPRLNESVLVIDAGGTNLRVARVHFDGSGQIVTEAVTRQRMPGTDGYDISAEEFFRGIAETVLPLSEGCESGAFCFSYPCEVLPDRDGRVIRLTKELHVPELPGMLVCAELSAAMRRAGAQRDIHWITLNDTVGSMLGGMAECDRSRYDDYVGFILGTGTNTCCSVPAKMITKSSAAMAQGGDIIVNLESGGFDKLLTGDADDILDAASVTPGSQREEKMISGAYLAELLRVTLSLAASDGLLSAETGRALRSRTADIMDVDALTRGRFDSGLPAALREDEREFAAGVNELLLRRAAKITAATFAAIVRLRELPSGSRVLVCADGTTFKKNLLLRPCTEEYLAAELLRPQNIAVDFIHVSDSTLLGTAYAALI